MMWAFSTLESRNIVPGTDVNHLNEQFVAPSRYEPLMSSYLSTARRLERWHFNWIKFDGFALTASARLDGWQASATDGNRFHLSIFSAREVDAQLAIISLHLKLGLTKKSAEVWLLKCTQECVVPITNAEDVRFEMSSTLRRSSNGKILTERVCTVSDDRGGLFKFAVLGLMPWDHSWGEPPVAM
jgi:hypothetical protein